MKKHAARAGAILMSMGLAACSMHGSQPAELTTNSNSQAVRPMDITGGIGPGRAMTVYMGDAAPNLGGKKLTHLNVGILEIDAISDGQSVMLAKYDQPKVVDVLAHQENDGERVARSGDATKTYQAIRFVVDLQSSQAVFRGNDTRPLDFLTNTSTFSSVHAGSNTTTTADGPGAVDLVVTQPFSIPENADPAVRVDFNAFESLALEQNGSIFTVPALFVAPMSDIGMIKGHVRNSSGGAVQDATVVAVAADGSIGNTTSTDDKGHFALGTLRSGSYQLVIYNAYTTAAGQQINASGASSNAPTVSGPSVTVTGSHTTAVGTLAD